jgi:hypothetical protein
MDLREEHQKNALIPSCFRRDAGANVIAQSRLESAKQSSRDSIDEGTQNELTEVSLISLLSIIVHDRRNNHPGEHRHDGQYNRDLSPC